MTPTPARPALDAMADLELEAACERYWNERFADGWSWTEMSAGVSGRIGLEQATDIRRAISAAINPIRTERDAALRSLADMREALKDVQADLIAYMLIHAADYASAGPSVEQYKEMIANLQSALARSAP